MHKVALASARAGNVIGGGDFANDRVVPDMVRAGIFNQELKIRNPKAIRPWQHVLEPLSGYLLLAQKLYENGAQYAEGWNFGPDDKDVKTVDWVVEEFSKQWKEKGGKLDWRIDTDPNPHEASLLKLNCVKANTELNWHQSLTVEQAISFTADWYYAYKNKCDMKNFTLEQIKKYETLGCKHEVH